MKVMSKLVIATVGALVFGPISASAATYNFKAAADGGIGEAIFSTFSTDSYFTGLNLDVTASASDDDDGSQYVYFDAGNAGMGVCKDPTSLSAVGDFNAGSGSNLCDPSSDDGITSLFEILTFTATESAMIIDTIWLNSNHDSPLPTDASYSINGVIYGPGSMFADSLSGTGDVAIFLGFTLALGDSFSIFSVAGMPDSYISGISVSEVPVPASALLMATGLFGVAAKPDFTRGLLLQRNL